VLAGIGLGFGYIVPVATLVRWFPDKRGMITGIAVAGFGAGALVTAPIATRLIEARGVMSTFAILGVVYLVMVAGAALLMRNPPEGWKPAGWGSRPKPRKPARGAIIGHLRRCPR
jgi:OFA family oxalate/formate antiporter-like MFS transporter